MNDIIERLRAIDANLKLKDGKLILDAPKGVIGNDLILQIKQNKASLISYLEKEREVHGFSNIPVIEKKEYYKLSSAQNRLFSLWSLNKEDLSYNMPVLKELEANISEEELGLVFENIIERHDVFRTRFDIIGNSPVQIISTQIDFEMEVIKLTDLQSLDSVANEFIRAFDLINGPLIRIGYIKGYNNLSYLIIDMHHIISDGVSHNLLEQEMFQLFSNTPQNPIKLQYKDYSEWQNSAIHRMKIEKQKSFWSEEMSGYLPKLNLPLDNTRSDKASNKGGVVSLLLNEQQTKNIRNLAQNNGSTLYMVMLSLTSIMLSKISGAEDFFLGLAIEGRSHPDLHKMVGMFVNSLPLRVNPANDKTFSELLKEVKDNSLKVFENRDYQFDKLIEDLKIERVEGRNPIFDVMVNVLNMSDVEEFNIENGNNKISFNTETKRFDLTLYIKEFKNAINLDFQFDSAIFFQETIKRYSDYFANIINIVSENSEMNIADIGLLKTTTLSKILETDLKHDILPKNKQPLSFHQERLWFIDEFEKGTLYSQSPVYHNLPILLAINGEIDLEVLENTLNYLISVNNILRVNVKSDEESRFQFIQAEAKFEIKTQLTDKEKLWKDIYTEIDIPFDISKDLLIRAKLFSEDDLNSYLLITVHHLICDKMSLNLLIKELITQYDHQLRGERIEENDTKIQFSEFNLWQQKIINEAKEHMLSYWMKKLKAPIQTLTLPEENKRANIHIYKAKSINFKLEESVTTQVRDFANNNGVNIKDIIFAVFKILLSRYCNESEIVVGTNDPNRNIGFSKDIIGPLSNLLVIRTYLEQNDTFNSFMNRLSSNILEAKQNCYVPFDLLVNALNPAKDMSRTALFDILFHYQDLTQNHFTSSTLNLELLETNLGNGKYDLDLLISNRKDSIEGTLVFNSLYFSDSIIFSLIKYLEELIKKLLAYPDKKLIEVETITEDEKKNILVNLNNNEVIYPRKETIIDIFEEQVQKYGDKTAIKFGQKGMTYKELSVQSNKIANYLIQRGVSKGDVIGVLYDRGFEVITAIIGILKVGGVYLPLDIEFPIARTNYMLENSNCKYLLTDKNKLDLNTDVEVIQEDILSLEKVQSDQPQISFSKDDLAYIIYTSGSTGKPKGVMVPQKGIINLLFNSDSEFSFSNEDVWSMFHSHCFDFSVWEMYGALLHGGKLVIIPKLIAIDTEKFLDVLHQEKITVLNQTPSAFYNLVNFEQEREKNIVSLRYVIFGGEALYPQKLQSWNKKYPLIKLINMYGITETTIHVTYKEIDEKDIQENKSNIGKPLPGMVTCILDMNKKIAPYGIIGEIYVGGEGVANGYINNEELTNKSFLKLPIVNNTRLYKTGDLARYLSNGELEYIGRIDDQLQLRGYRIELGEIQSVVQSSKSIDECVIITISNKTNISICAYVVVNSLYDSEKFIIELSNKLPPYMVPSHIIKIDRIPLTPNGKIDKPLLPAPNKDIKELIPPKNEIEKDLIKLWSNVLEIEEEGIGANYKIFDIGGNSIKVTVFKNKIKKSLNVDIPLSEMMKNPSFVDLGVFIQGVKLLQEDRTDNKEVTKILL